MLGMFGHVWPCLAHLGPTFHLHEQHRTMPHQGIDCIDGCRFALVFPIVVAHFARFSTNNLTALKLLTQEMGLAARGDAGAGWSNVVRIQRRCKVR